MNDYHFKLVKFRGEFVWHHHADTETAGTVNTGGVVSDKTGPTDDWV